MKEIDDVILSQVINKYDLKNSSRKREYVWKRSAFYNFMKKNGYGWTYISRLIDKDHATIINGLKVYKENLRYEDFKHTVKEIEVDLKYCLVSSTPDDYSIREIHSMVMLENLISDKL